jgi:hypothetical protein
MPAHVVELLLGALTVLAGIVWNNQEKRIAALEAQSKDDRTDRQTLREAVIRLTVTVEHLAKQLGNQHAEGE